MLRLRLLGPPIIEHNMPLASFKSRKVEALLYYLSMVPGKHHRSHLATLLWSELPEDKALSNLRFALWNLKKVLVDAPFEADRLTVTSQSSGNIWLDVHEFQTNVAQIETNDVILGASDLVRLQEGVNLYRGDFLIGFEVSDAPFFDEWLQQQRATFHGVAVEALSRLGTHYTTHHHLTEAIAVTRRLLDLEPWQENAHRQMMILLALSGQRGAALDHYQKCCQILAEELDLDPELETTELMERIQAGQLEAMDRQITNISQTTWSDMPLVGRHTEHAWLLECWEQTRQGSGRLVLLRGEAGVGKTHLIEEMSRSALGQGAILLRGRCYEFSGAVPYQPIATAVQKQIPQLQTRSHSLNDTWLAELSQLLPEIRILYPDLPQITGGGQQADRYRLFEAITRFLQTIAANQPALLFLDDLHWADTDTLDLLTYLVRHLINSPILIIGTYRPDVVLPSHPLNAVQQALDNEGLVEELELAPLSKEAIEQIVYTLPTNIADPYRLALFLTQISEGNPFILFETLREVEEQEWPQLSSDSNSSLQEGPLGLEALIPVKVQTRIQRRVGRLTSESQYLLSIAAVIGREFEIELLQAASDASSRVVLDCLDDWLARHLVREIVSPEPSTPDIGLSAIAADYRYDFSHDLIRAVVYNDLSQARRRILHNQVGDALEQRYGNKINTVVERLAHHFQQAQDLYKALTYLQQAGHQAQAVYALPTALERYQQALAQWERIYNPTSDTTPTEVWRQRWDLLLSQARVSYMLGQVEKQRFALDTVAYEVVKWGDEQDQLHIIVQQLVYLQKTIELNHRQLAAKEGLGLARLLGDDLAEGKILQALGNCDREVGHYSQALNHYQAALDKFTYLKRHRQAAFCLINIGGTYLITNHRNQTLRSFGEAERYAKIDHHQDALIWSRIAMAHTHLVFGDLEKAAGYNQEALELCQITGFQRPMSVGLVIQGRINDLRGDPTAAKTHYEQAWIISQEMGQISRMVDIECCLGHLYLGQNDPAQALPHFAEAQGLGENTFIRRVIEAKSYQGMAHLALGELDAALDHSHQAIAQLLGRAHGLEAPQRLYWNHYQILQAWGQIDEAQTALITAHEMVLEQANHLIEVGPLPLAAQETIKEQFLTLPWNQVIIEAWKQLSLARYRRS